MPYTVTVTFEFDAANEAQARFRRTTIELQVRELSRALLLGKVTDVELQWKRLGEPSETPGT